MEKATLWGTSLFYSSPDIIRLISSSRLRCAGHVVHMGEGRNGTEYWWENPMEKIHLEDQVLDGRIGSKWTVVSFVARCGLDSHGSCSGPQAGSCECGDEPSGNGPTALFS
jgi:hypothetical protein